MEDVTIMIGLLRSWNTARGFGFIDVPTAVFPLKKYFLHVSDILEGSNPPPVGSMVRFEVGSPRKAGQLPIAKKAWIIAPKNMSLEVL
jgi:cold shock CspA family protein